MVRGCKTMAQRDVAVLCRKASHLDKIALPLVLAAAAIGKHIADVQVGHQSLVVVNDLAQTSVMEEGIPLCRTDDPPYVCLGLLLGLLLVLFVFLDMLGSIWGCIWGSIWECFETKI